MLKALFLIKPTMLKATHLLVDIKFYVFIIFWYVVFGKVVEYYSQLFKHEFSVGGSVHVYSNWGGFFWYVFFNCLMKLINYWNRCYRSSSVIFQSLLKIKKDKNIEKRTLHDYVWDMEFCSFLQLKESHVKYWFATQHVHYYSVTMNKQRSTTSKYSIQKKLKLSKKSFCLSVKQLWHAFSKHTWLIKEARV